MKDISEKMANDIIAMSVEISKGINGVSEVYGSLLGKLDDELRRSFAEHIGTLLSANFRLERMILKHYPELDPDAGKDVELDPEIERIISEMKKSVGKITLKAKIHSSNLFK